METKTSSALGYFFALAATVLWSTVFPLVRIFPPDLSSLEISFWRWAFTLIALLPFVLSELKKNWRLTLANWKWLAPAGILGFSGYSLLMFEAGHTTNATNMSLFAATAPISMALLSRVFLKERISRTQVVGLAIAVFGVIVLVLHGDFTLLSQMTFTIGDIWMLTAAFLFAVYSILIRNRQAQLPQNLCMASMLIFGVSSLTAPMFPVLISPTYRLPETNILLILLYIAVVPTLIGYMFWNRSVEHIGAARAGIVYYSIPLFSSIEAVFLLGETIQVSQMIGGTLIIGGILLSSLNVIKQIMRK